MKFHLYQRYIGKKQIYGFAHKSILREQVFFILFATFTRNVEWQREALQLLGIHQVHIISGQDLVQRLKMVGDLAN